MLASIGLQNMWLLQVDLRVNSLMLKRFANLHLLEFSTFVSYQTNLHLYGLDIPHKTIGHVKIKLVRLVEFLYFQ